MAAFPVVLDANVKAEIIVTENTRHFPVEACRPYGIETRTLDEFVTDLVSLSAPEVWASIVEMAYAVRTRR